MACRINSNDKSGSIRRAIRQKKQEEGASGASLGRKSTVKPGSCVPCVSTDAGGAHIHFFGDFIERHGLEMAQLDDLRPARVDLAKLSDSIPEIDLFDGNASWGFHELFVKWLSVRLLRALGPLFLAQVVDESVLHCTNSDGKESRGRRRDLSPCSR